MSVMEEQTPRSSETQLRDDRTHSENTTTALSRALDDTRAGLGTQIRELVDALDRLAETCRGLYIAERDHHRALLDALARIGAALQQPTSTQQQRPAAPGRVVGRTIDPAPVIDADDEPAWRRWDGSSRNAVLLDGVEVRCRFADNHWVGGFEVCDVFAMAPRCATAYAAVQMAISFRLSSTKRRCVETVYAALLH
jgi:hypothetical protein